MIDKAVKNLILALRGWYVVSYIIVIKISDLWAQYNWSCSVKLNLSYDMTHIKLKLKCYIGIILWFLFTTFFWFKDSCEIIILSLISMIWQPLNTSKNALHPVSDIDIDIRQILTLRYVTWIICAIHMMWMGHGPWHGMWHRYLHTWKTVVYIYNKIEGGSIQLQFAKQRLHISTTQSCPGESRTRIKTKSNFDVYSEGRTPGTDWPTILKLFLK